MTDHKRLVYGGRKGLDNRITRLVKTGWRVVRTEIDRWANGKKVYIAELEKR